MADYLLKSKILKEYSKLDLYNKANKIIFKYVYTDSVSDEEYKNALSTLAYLERHSEIEYKEYGRILHAKFARVARLKKRISDMVLNYDCLFLTLTFTNDKLSSTSAPFRRLAVKRFLAQFGVPYVANIDFGAKNGREHYHAILCIAEIDYHLWKYGAINGMKIRNNIIFDDNGVVTSESVERLSRYIAKLTNHAIKETTKRCAIMYSRKKNKFKIKTAESVSN